MNRSVAIQRLLPDLAVNAGSAGSFPTAGQIAPRRRVLGFFLVMDCDLTQPGAAQAAQLGSVLPQLLSLIKLGRRVVISGLAARIRNWMVMGSNRIFPAGFPATASAVFSRKVVWPVWFTNPLAYSPFDGAIPSELFTDPVEVLFGTNSIFAATAPTIGNGLLRCYVVHDGDVPDEGVDVPISPNIQSESFSALVAVINKPGAWVRAALFREASNDAGGITSAQVTNAISYVDGGPVVINSRAQDLATFFNLGPASGAGYQFESQTLPIGGEQIQDQPGVAAAAGQGVTSDFVPLLVPPPGYKATQLPLAAQGAKFEFAGSLTSYKIVYDIIESRSEGMTNRAAAKLGVQSGIWTPKTEGGSTLKNPAHVGIMPLRVRHAPGRRVGRR